MRSFAHIMNTDGGLPSMWLVAGCLAIVALIIEHRVVAGRPVVPAVRGVVGAIVVTAMSALLLPTISAQNNDLVLPDLISDPPAPSFFSELEAADGSSQLLLTFDGYVHNIGDGPLEVIGNPQEPNGMVQRVLDGDDWQEVGFPTVRFETDDGHNHFHLIEAIEYVLWNEKQGSQTAIGSKVGFCLVDSEQMEPGVDEAAYSEDLDNFCDENNPDSTDLRMGISPGWRDIYDATTTLQWVDVSNVAPGRYWIGAITDPNDEIEESNEDNNALIFSEQTVAIPGYAVRAQPVVQVDTSVVEVSLPIDAHGDVTQPIFVVEQGPTGGTLDVPIGADFDTGVVRYTPAADFVGSDEFVFSVRDAASRYPLERPLQVVELEVEAGIEFVAPDGPEFPTTLAAPSTFFESAVGDYFEVDVAAAYLDDEPARLFASGLPTGLVADTATGTISGVPTVAGIFDVTLTAFGEAPGSETVQVVSWIVNGRDGDGGLVQTPDTSSPRGVATRVRVGTGLGLTLETTGLPPGVEIDPTAPFLMGSPTEIGEFDITVRQMALDEVVGERSFTWTIRPTTDIEFAL